MTSKHYIELRELSSTTCDAAVLEAASGLPRERLMDALKGLVMLEPSWSGRQVRIVAGQTVGTMRIESLRIDVRPKLAAAEMATLLRYALGGPPVATQRSSILTARCGIDELIGRVFAEELTRLRQLGLSRLYVSRQDKLPALRGRPDFIASFPWNERGMTTLACRYHELTCDTLDNQILRVAAERAAMMDVTAETRRHLLEHRQAWMSIASHRPIGHEHFAMVRTRYTRLTEHYRLAHNLSELILAAYRPAAIFTDAEHPTMGLRIGMAWLFERFVERLVRQTLGPYGITVRSQDSDRGALLDGEARSYAAVRPDMVASRHGEPVAVLDSKYKDYWRAQGADGFPANRISNGDIYQLFFYAQRLQIRHKLQSPPEAIIISPIPAEDERVESAISERFCTVRWQVGGDVACRLRLVFVPMTQILRALAAGRTVESALGEMLVSRLRASV